MVDLSGVGRPINRRSLRKPVNPGLALLLRVPGLVAPLSPAAKEGRSLMAGNPGYGRQEYDERLEAIRWFSFASLRALGQKIRADGRVVFGLGRQFAPFHA